MPKLYLLIFTLLGLSGFAKAEWIALPWKALGATLPIWKPDDFDAAKKYPVIIHYHAVGEEPTAQFIHKATGGEDFVLVGMTYANCGESERTAQEISHELGILNALKVTLIKSVSVDPKKIYVSGFSKGGWHAAMLLDRDRELAGGIIMGAGIWDARPRAPKLSNATPIYIGSGRFDQNYPRGLEALLYFRGLNADVTLEQWPDLGHALPGETPESLRQWLRIRSGTGSLVQEARSWSEARFAEIAETEDPVDQWYELEEFVSRPFVKPASTDTSEKARMVGKILLEKPAVATESKLVKRSQSILARECQDRLLATLQSASQAYFDLAKEAGEKSRAGRAANRDFERTQKLMKTAKVITKEPVPRGKMIPELPPVSPSSNPNRGPFFPPGIEVKPAD